MRRRERGGALIVGTSESRSSALLFAVLRPVKIAARESVVGARVVVLADTSRSMALPGDNGAARIAKRDLALASLQKNAHDARLLVLGFGDGAPRPLAPPDGALGTAGTSGAGARAPRSDLTAAMRRARELAGRAPLDRDRGRGATGDSTTRPRAPPRTPFARSAMSFTSRFTRSRRAAGPRPTRAFGASQPRVQRSPTSRCRCGWRSAAGGGLVVRRAHRNRARAPRRRSPPALFASGLAHVKDGEGDASISPSRSRSAGATHPRGRDHAAAAATPIPGERPAAPDVQRLARAGARPPRRGAPDATTCARSCGPG